MFLSNEGISICTIGSKNLHVKCVRSIGPPRTYHGAPPFLRRICSLIRAVSQSPSSKFVQELWPIQNRTELPENSLRCEKGDTFFLQSFSFPPSLFVMDRTKRACIDSAPSDLYPTARDFAYGGYVVQDYFRKAASHLFPHTGTFKKCCCYGAFLTHK